LDLSDLNKIWYLLTNKIPFLAAIPNKLINPIVDAIEIIPLVKYTITIPPIKASGKLINTMADNLKSENSA